MAKRRFVQQGCTSNRLRQLRRSLGAKQDAPLFEYSQEAHAHSALGHLTQRDRAVPAWNLFEPAAPRRMSAAMDCQPIDWLPFRVRGHPRKGEGA